MDRARGKSVSITLKHSPILKLKNFTQKGRVEIPEGTTVRALLKRIGIHSNHHRYILVYTNGRKRGLDYGLQQDDAVQLFLPIGGELIPTFFRHRCCRRLTQGEPDKYYDDDGAKTPVV